MTRFRASRASLTLTANNLLTLWRAEAERFGHRQPDPEVRDNSNEHSPYNQEGWPQLKRFMATLRVTF